MTLRGKNLCCYARENSNNKKGALTLGKMTLGITTFPITTSSAVPIVFYAQCLFLNCYAELYLVLLR